MRMMLAGLLALVAIGAGGVWALGQFGPLAPAPVAREDVNPKPDNLASAEPAPATPPASVAPPEPAPEKTAKPAAKPTAKPASKPAPAPTTPPQVVASATPEPAPPTPSPAPAPTATGKPSLKDLAKQALNKEIKKVEIPGGVSTPGAKPTSAFVDPAPTGNAPPAPAPEQTTAAAPAPQPAPGEKLVSTAEVHKTPAAPAGKSPAAPQGQAQPTTVTAASTESKAVANVTSQLQTAAVTYKRPPPVLELNKGIDLALIIDITGKGQAKVMLQDIQGNTQERTLDLPPEVAVTLTGATFEFESQTEQKQALSTEIANQWRWRVKPTETGQKTLTLTISAVGERSSKPINYYTDQINVEVKQFDAVVGWAKGVQPVFAIVAALAGILSAFFAFMRFRTERKKTL